MEFLTETQQLYSRLSQLTPMTEKQWSELEAYGGFNHYQAGEMIFMPNEKTSKIRLITRGTACHFYIKPDGTRRNKSFLGVAEVASSLSSLHTGEPARFGCEALTQVSCFSIPFGQFSHLSKTQPHWQQLTQALLTRLALKKEAREADLLLLSPTELYLKFRQKNPELLDSLPNYHIASYLGISEVSLSRIRAKLGLQNAYNRVI